MAKKKTVTKTKIRIDPLPEKKVAPKVKAIQKIEETIVKKQSDQSSNQSNQSGV